MNIMKKIFTIVFVLFFGIGMYAQTVVSGTVTDSKDGQPIPGVNIKVAGKALGTTTDFDGKYTLKVAQSPPFKIQVSNLGYISQTIEITKNDQTVDVSLVEAETTLDEVVVSASRTPESIRESPVTIERMDVRDIKNSSAASFYQSIENLKGVDVNTGSLTFNAVNTRGFATFANTRFVQLIDGMDNSSPALNFVLGNLVGMNELDVKSVELLPGASSALYGANAFNGILFMTSKSPFDDQGISVYLKTGITSQDAAGDNEFYDVGIRAAHAFSEKFAAKVSFSYLDGTDWYATDDNQYTRTVVGQPDAITPFSPSRLAHDGLNIYGDEIQTNIHDVALQLEAGGIIPAGASALIPEDVVGRTGYREQDLTNYDARSAKLDVSLNYRPFANDLEIIWNTRVGFGNSIYQGADRYSLNNFLMQQHKFEIRNKDFFVRAYTTSETAGDSYDMRFAGINMNRVNSPQWFGTYVGAYLQAVLGGATSDQAHAGARQFADTNITPQPGTPEFQTLFNQVTSDPNIATGSKFLDNTKMYHAEGNYNFSSLLNEAADIQIGGSYRRYSLDSQGTIFTDADGPIEYNEFGAYVQASKKFADERLKLTASFRYDKNDFFDGNVSPRASIVYSAGENKQHNFRASFQTGFRNPDTQSLFIGFDVGRAILVGSSPDNLDRPLPNTTLTGRDIYFDSYTTGSVQAFGAAVQAAIAGGTPPPLAVAQNAGLLQSVQTDLVQPEEVTAYDIGYRGRLGKVNVDFNAYYNNYNDFIANKFVITPVDGSTTDLTTFSGAADIASGNFRVIQTYTNSKADVSSYGATIGLDTKVGNGFTIGINYTYAKLDFDQASDPDFQAGFNTPENKVKVSFGNPKLFKNFGFNINGRWSDEYFWQSSSANAIVDSRTVIDAQLNYSIPKWKSTFKIGGSNIGGNEYFSAPGAGAVGAQYYVSWIINQ
jgi:outer membrane receptor protein involved in Fe transport